MSLSGKSKADIITSSPERIDAAQGGIWQRVEQLIGRLDFQGLVRIEEPVNGVYTAVFRKGTDPHAVKGSISTIWPEVKLTYNGLEVNEATEYDFSHDVEIVAKANLFGHKGVTQRVVLRFKEDLSHECEFLALSLAKEHNPGLLEDLVTDVTSQTIAIAPQATEGVISTPARVVLTFKLSDGAVLKLANELLESGVTPLDLTQPRMLTVVAANGTAKHYELLLQQPQTIGWALGDMSYEYGSTSVPVEASASSGLPLTFTSTHPEVATVAGGRLHIGFPGTTTLTALQAGEGIWAEAQPITRQVTVTKRPVTVRIKDVLYRAGYPVIPQYEYSNLAKDADTASIPSSYEQGCFTVKDAEGKEVSLPGELPVGVYTVDTVRGKHFATSCYTISPQSARFEVVQADRWQVKITVRNTDGVLSGATVLLGMEKRLTDNGGDAAWYLPAGGKYLFEARMPGYAPATVEVFTEQRNIAQTVTLQRGTIELKYTVSSSVEGQILGPAFQRLAPNSVGEEVYVVPALGYKFAQWSDGKLDNPRRDGHLTQSVEFMAQFSRVQVLLRYTAAGGGTLKNGAVEQQVDYGADGPTVEAVPDSGYYFQGWSDGVSSPVRTDRAVKRDVLVEAIFGKYYTIPATEDFELGVLGNGWYSESKGKSYNPWGITTLKQSELEPLDGHYAYCNSDAMGRNGRTESYLYTPCYRLGNAWSGDLIVSFDYGSKNVNARTDQFWVELSVDTGAWVKIGEVEHNTRGTLLLTVAGSELEGKRTVQFRWGYKAMWAYAVGIDNVVIAKKSNEKLNLQYVADPTGSCTFDKLRDDGALDVPNITAQEVIVGERPAAVRANPAPGFTFVSWENGSKDSIRMLKCGVYISQTFTATCRNRLKSTITYQIAPTGAGVCRMDGQDVAMQEVDTGGDAKPVTAVPASGYRFLYWSDSGDTCQVYTRRNVRTSEIVTAVFAKVDSFATEFLVVNEAGEPLLGAVVAISGQEFATNADGRASILLEEGDYPYRVGMPGDHTWEGIAKVSLIKSLNRAVLAKSSFTVTFAVGLNGERIPGVSIKVNGQTRITDTVGLASIELPNGVYTYQASKEGYDATQGEITVKDADLLVEIPLIRSQKPKPEPKPDIVDSTLLAGILASPNPCGDVLRLEHTEALRLVEVLNASGQTVQTSRHDGRPELLLGMETLPAGLYILRLVDCQGGTRNLRVVKR